MTIAELYKRAGHGLLSLQRAIQQKRNAWAARNPGVGPRPSWGGKMIKVPDTMTSRPVSGAWSGTNIATPMETVRVPGGMRWKSPSMFNTASSYGPRTIARATGKRMALGAALGVAPALYQGVRNYFNS